MLVMGATGAAGSATVRRLRARGATVLAVGRRGDALDLLAEECGAVPFVADATDGTQVEAAVQAAMTRFGRLDGAANLVGSVLLKPLHLTRDEEFAATLQLNLWSAFWLVKAAVRAMDQGGSVVLASTAAVRTGLPNHEAIAAAKGAVEGLALAAAATYAPKQIRVNVVAPGLVRAAMTARITGSAPALAASTAMHALGRIGEGDDVASAVCWFLDPANSWTTGQVLGVDGGLGALRGRPG
jgi:NAD(P)-dependent dehydrogenase (short-subunit alcohol dehydrogenase family)